MLPVLPEPDFVVPVELDVPDPAVFEGPDPELLDVPVNPGVLFGGLVVVPALLAAFLVVPVEFDDVGDDGREAAGWNEMLA